MRALHPFLLLLALLAIFCFSSSIFFDIFTAFLGFAYASFAFFLKSTQS